MNTRVNEGSQPSRRRRSQTRSRLRSSCLLLTLLLLSSSAASRAATTGVVVETAEQGFAVEKPALEPGDVLLSWHRAASPPANPRPAHGDFVSPFDVFEVKLEQAPRGELTFSGTRGGQSFDVVMPAGKWSVTVRPRISGRDLEEYLAGKSSIEAEETEAGLALWDRQAERFRASGRHDLAGWLHSEIAEAHSRLRAWEAARAAFEQAIDEVDGLDGLDERSQSAIRAQLLTSLAGVFERQNDLVAAGEGYEAALAARRAVSRESLAMAENVNRLGAVALYRGDLFAAAEAFGRSLETRQRLAPDSAEVAGSLNNLGLVAWRRGDLAAAEGYLGRAQVLRERLAPGSLEEMYGFYNLGLIAWAGHDLLAAEHYLAKARAIVEALAPDGLLMAQLMTAIGGVATSRGDFAAAEEVDLEALAIRERLAPGSLVLARTLHNLGAAAARRGEHAKGKAYLQRALGLMEELAPGSLDMALALASLGTQALERGELAAAEEHFRQALEIRARLAPDSTMEAQSAHELGIVYRRQGETGRALELFDRALAALEAQKGKLGGSQEARSGFAAQYARFYRDDLDLLIELGRPEEAFHVLERYRAGQILALLAERDLIFTADIPPQLDRDRRLANAEADGILGELAGLWTADGEAQRQDARRRLRAARQRQEEVRRQIRAASPRLGALKYPQPADLAETRQILDPGTLLLSYAVGEEKSYLLTAGSADGDSRVFPLDVGEAALREEIERFRAFLRQDSDPEAVRRMASRLSDQLLAPAAALVARARRLLILPDGPLHYLPFAVLDDPSAGEPRYLVEAKPLYLSASATVFRELKQRRRQRSETRVVAFGDPSYPAPAKGRQAADPALRSTQRGGLRLAPLASTRGEVLSLREIFPETSRIYLGSEATEEAAKSLGRDDSIVHFACHGVIDESAPLESALALTIPESWGDGRDNGLLQAWEIFEQVRIDADLVTLSACETALGKELAGEGMLGLTRAFQYAGSRSVLASLWSVNDATTAELMRRFYGYLKSGQAMAEALRSAQLDLLREPIRLEGGDGAEGFDASHPYYWAAFQLSGDWR